MHAPLRSLPRLALSVFLLVLGAPTSALAVAEAAGM